MGFNLTLHWNTVHIEGFSKKFGQLGETYEFFSHAAEKIISFRRIPEIQDVSKKFSSLGFCLIISGRLYRLIFFPFLLGAWKILKLKKTWDFQDAQKNSGSFEIFRLPKEYTNVWKNSSLPQHFWHSGKIQMLENFGRLGIFMLPDNFKHLQKVEEILHLCPNILGALKKSWCWIIFREFENFYFAR